MHLQINIDTTETLSEADRALLHALLGDGKAAATPPEPKAEKPVSAPKKAAAKKSTPKPAPEPEEAEEDDEDVLGTDAPTRADAVARATELVSSGKAAQVKAALNSVGAKRVSEVADEDIASFMDALS